VGEGKKILAVASGGGHWVQLVRLLPAFEGHRLIFATTDPSYRLEVGSRPLYVVTDASRWSKLGLLKLMFQVFRILLRERPDVVISTGAAPGLFAILAGRLVGARTVWVDSMANIERLSLSGRLIGRFTHLWLTQWPHLARPGGPRCAGSVL